jgi:hypothetical protein
MDEVLIVDHQVDVIALRRRQRAAARDQGYRAVIAALTDVKAEIESVRLSPLLDREPGIDHLLSIAAGELRATIAQVEIRRHADPGPDEADMVPENWEEIPW